MAQKRRLRLIEPRRRLRATCLDAERLRYNSPTLMRVRAEQQWRVASWESTSCGLDDGTSGTRERESLELHFINPP